MIDKKYTTGYFGKYTFNSDDYVEVNDGIIRVKRADWDKLQAEKAELLEFLKGFYNNKK